MTRASLGRLIDLYDQGTVRQRAPLLAAHRGAVGPGAPENSLAALDGAATAVFDLVEIDVEATRDGVPVLFHPDPVGTMRTACGIDAAVADLTAAELQTVRHRASDQRLPRLDEALARCATHGLGVVLDVKASARRPPVLEHIADLSSALDVETERQLWQRLVGGDARRPGAAHGLLGGP